MAEFNEMTASDYGVKKKPIAARNPQTNSIIERIHQTIGNVIGSFEVYDTNIDEKDPLNRDSQCGEICNKSHSAYYHACNTHAISV
eukprot:6579109-Ditylum_brightwellii.AAC.1